MNKELQKLDLLLTRLTNMTVEELAAHRLELAYDCLRERYGLVCSSIPFRPFKEESE